MEGTSQKPKSCRFCRVLLVRLLGPPKWRGTSQKPKSCRFCRGRFFCGSHFQIPCGFPGFPASGTAEMEGTSQKPKSCRFCCPAPRTAEMERTSQKPKSCRFCRVRSFCGSHFQSLSGSHGFPASGTAEMKGS